MSKELLKYAIELSEINGISSREEKVADYIKNVFKSNKSFKIERDNLGAVAVIKETKKGLPTVQFMAHMDEVGFMITKIEKNGFLKFQPIGGWWSHVVLAQRFVITTDANKEIFAVAGAMPPHLLTDALRARTVDLENIFLDIGAESDVQVKSLGIKVGDMVTPASKTFLGADKNTIIGKAHDDRAAVAVGISVMEQIAKLKLDCNVIFVASTQEEVGLRGAKTAAYKWTPDISFAVDVTIANDMPGMEEKETKLRTGVALSMFDRSILGNYKLVKEMEKVCVKSKIKYTFDGLAKGGTDAGSIHLTKDGVKTMTLSIPSRYIHSHNSMVALSDMEATTKALVEFIKAFNSKKLSELSYK